MLAISAGLALAATAIPSGAGCSSLSIARVQPENVAVGPGLRPIAVIQANAISGYLFFIPLPGGVSLDRVVNRMLIVAAKTIGADKVANLQFEQTPDGGVWAIRKLLGWRSASASAVAVQVEAAPADPTADDGPEPAPAPAPDDAAPSGGPPLP
jgi:hypothetical protein